MFCKYCGVANPDNASFCGDCGKAIGAKTPRPLAPQTEPQTTSLGAAPAPTAEPPATPPGPAATPVPPPARKSYRRAWIGICIILVVLVTVISRVLLSGLGPEDSFNQARMAYLNHDQVKFDKYVDVRSVLGDWVSQTAGKLMGAHGANAQKALDAWTEFDKVQVTYFSSWSQSIDRLVASGTLMLQPDPARGGADENLVAKTLSSSLYTLALSHSRYEGIAKSIFSDREAVLYVKVGTPRSSQPVVIAISMRKAGNHWRVVKVDHIFQFLGQLSRDPSQVSSN